MQQQDLIPHLFRTEFRKITSVLCKLFGIEHIQVAEDIASDTFLAAAETWTYKGIPSNPTAWLYAVAKNKAKNRITRDHVFSQKIALHLKQAPETEEPEINLTEQNITDSQLQMLFVICHPSIPVEAQIGLALRILCGFGIDEIASAFLSNKETINKRLYRAKEKLREEKIEIEVPGDTEILQRLETVALTLYLLFSEGYYSENNDTVLRKDLCLEAMRLTLMLIENEKTNLPFINALFALMCFHASRFEARENKNGEIILYEDQDETLWDQELITKGAYYLHKSSYGQIYSKYHLEASIAYWHTIKTASKEKWENILQLYNKLLILEYSPIAALNRTFALSRANSKQEAILAAEKLNLTDNHFYYALLGELYTGIDNAKAITHLQRALTLARSAAEKNVLRTRILKLEILNSNP